MLICSLDLHYRSKHTLTEQFSLSSRCNFSACQTKGSPESLPGSDLKRPEIEVRIRFQCLFFRPLQQSIPFYYYSVVSIKLAYNNHVFCCSSDSHQRQFVSRLERIANDLLFIYETNHETNWEGATLLESPGIVRQAK